MKYPLQFIAPEKMHTYNIILSSIKFVINFAIVENASKYLVYAEMLKNANICFAWLVSFNIAWRCFLLSLRWISAKVCCCCCCCFCSCTHYISVILGTNHVHNFEKHLGQHRRICTKQKWCNIYEKCVVIGSIKL